MSSGSFGKTVRSSVREDMPIEKGRDVRDAAACKIKCLQPIYYYAITPLVSHRFATAEPTDQRRSNTCHKNGTRCRNKIQHVLHKVVAII